MIATPACREGGRPAPAGNESKQMLYLTMRQYALFRIISRRQIALQGEIRQFLLEWVSLQS